MKRTLPNGPKRAFLDHLVERHGLPEDATVDSSYSDEDEDGDGYRVSDPHMVSVPAQKHEYSTFFVKIPAFKAETRAVIYDLKQDASGPLDQFNAHSFYFHHVKYEITIDGRVIEFEGSAFLNGIPLSGLFTEETGMRVMATIEDFEQNEDGKLSKYIGYVVTRSKQDVRPVVHPVLYDPWNSFYSSVTQINPPIVKTNWPVQNF